MARKYLKKITALARFHTTILSKYDLNQVEKEKYWKEYLNLLYKQNKISRHQAKVWKYSDDL